MANVSLTPDLVAAKSSSLQSKADELTSIGTQLANLMQEASQTAVKGQAGTALAAKAAELRAAVAQVANDSQTKAQTVGRWGHQNVEMQAQQASAANGIPTVTVQA